MMMHFPLIVVLAHTNAVVTDFFVPYGVLAQSGAVKVIAVSMAEEPSTAKPLNIVPDMTAAEFDRAYPDDAVIVPATADKQAEDVAWAEETARERCSAGFDQRWRGVAGGDRAAEWPSRGRPRDVVAPSPETLPAGDLAHERALCGEW